jgi:hypothetical protein
MVVGGISDAAVSRSDGGAAAVKSLFYFIFFRPFSSISSPLLVF